MINLDPIGFIEAQPAGGYPPELLQFFADVERDWVALGGFPHNGKMYGFSDPDQVNGPYTAPFNPSLLRAVNARRTERVAAFNAYRLSRDPTGVLYNTFLRQLLGEKPV